MCSRETILSDAVNAAQQANSSLKLHTVPLQAIEMSLSETISTFYKHCTHAVYLNTHSSSILGQAKNAEKKELEEQ